MKHAPRALLAFMFLAALSPLSAQAADVSPATQIALETLPARHHKTLMHDMLQIQGAVASGNKADLANSKAIYEQHLGTALARVSGQLGEASQQLTARPSDTALQGKVTQLQQTLQTLLAINATVQSTLSQA